MVKKNFAIGNYGDYIVFPKYGVGKCNGYQQVNVDGKIYEMLVINFDKSKMILRLPKAELGKVACRPLSTKAEMDQALKRLSVRTKVCQNVWKDRVESYCRKINSNRLHSIAEVINELHPLIKNHTYAMREFEIYQRALDLLAQELAAVDSCEMESALEKIAAFTRPQEFLFDDAASKISSLKEVKTVTSY